MFVRLKRVTAMQRGRGQEVSALWFLVATNDGDREVSVHKGRVDGQTFGYLHSQTRSGQKAGPLAKLILERLMEAGNDSR